jgi:hypothetical protein
MSKETTLSTTSSAFRKTTNPAIQTLRDSAWVHKPELRSKKTLYEDAREGNISIANDAFEECVEYTNHKKSIEDANDETDDRKKEAVRQYVFNRLKVPTLTFNKLNSAWESNLLYIFRSAIKSSLNNSGYDIARIRKKAEIRYEGDKVFIDVVYSGLEVKRYDSAVEIPTTDPKLHSLRVLNTETKPTMVKTSRSSTMSLAPHYKIPGELTCRFMLVIPEDRGLDAEFKFISSSATQPILLDLATQDRVDITPELLTFYAAAAKLEKSMTHFANVDERTAPVKAVLDEVMRLQGKRFGGPSIEKLTEVLDLADQLMGTPVANKNNVSLSLISDPYDDETIQYFRVLANELGGFSWGKLLSGAMMALAGAAVAVLGAISILAPLSLPVTMPTIAAVFSVASGSCAATYGLSMFSEGAKRKPAHAILTDLADAAQNYKRAMA